MQSELVHDVAQVTIPEWRARRHGLLVDDRLVTEQVIVRQWRELALSSPRGAEHEHHDGKSHRQTMAGRVSHS
jgi:hypothetical protein